MLCCHCESTLFGTCSYIWQNNNECASVLDIFHPHKIQAFNNDVVNPFLHVYAFLEMANSVDSDQLAYLYDLIRVCTVCFLIMLFLTKKGTVQILITNAIKCIYMEEKVNKYIFSFPG
jgi:hypothetical protein